MLNPVICPSCFTPNEPGRGLCWKCMRDLSDPVKEEDYIRMFDLKPGWTTQDLKGSFLRLAKKFHPDANPGNREADAFFKFVNQAYEILSRVGNQGSAPEPAKPAQPAAPPPQKEPPANQEYAELQQTLQQMIQQAKAGKNKPAPLTRSQKIAKFFGSLFGK